MEIVIFRADMQKQVNEFFDKCFSAVGIPFAPDDRHADIADVEKNYMQSGCFWCLTDGDRVIGTIALRELDATEKLIELKRMFVLPTQQGKGYGRKLLEHALTEAKERDYDKICLDTRKQFSVAQYLYRSVGFQETDRYNDNEHAELYFELVL